MSLFISETFKDNIKSVLLIFIYSSLECTLIMEWYSVSGFYYRKKTWSSIYIQLITVFNKKRCDSEVMWLEDCQTILCMFWIAFHYCNDKAMQIVCHCMFAVFGDTFLCSLYLKFMVACKMLINIAENCVRFEVLMAVAMKSTISWDVMLCSLVVYRRLEEHQ